MDISSLIKSGLIFECVQNIDGLRNEQSVCLRVFSIYFSMSLLMVLTYYCNTIYFLEPSYLSNVTYMCSGSPLITSNFSLFTIEFQN